jgi:hypothetical protein
MTKIEKQIATFINKAKLTRAEMIRSEPGNLHVDQVNTSLIFITPMRTYIYELGYVDNHTNKSSNPPPKTLLWEGYLLKIIQEASLKTQPELFLEMLKRSNARVRPVGYKVYTDGKLVFNTTNRRKMSKMVNYIKDCRNDPTAPEHALYRHVNVIKIVDLGGHSIYLIHQRATAKYNPFYTELGKEPVLL